MRARRMLEPAFANALYIIDGCHKDWMVAGFLFPRKNPSYPHYNSLWPICFSRPTQYGELVLLTNLGMGNAWFIVVNILIELAIIIYS